MLDVNYKVSLYKGKNRARWNINKNEGIITFYISNIWDESTSIEMFMEWMIYYTIMERTCLERAFNKVKIKGGRCNPCCVENLTFKMYCDL